MLPFDLLGFDCDNGTEFLNYHLFKYLRERPNPVNFTSSRAYQKQDNAHVEQKTWTHVRQWLGYDRYRREWRLLHNFFLPSVKLIEKGRLGSKTLKRHDLPKTPYQRVMKSSHIHTGVKQALSKQIEKLNPFLLRKIIEEKLKKISSLK